MIFIEGWVSDTGLGFRYVESLVSCVGNGDESVFYYEDSWLNFYYGSDATRIFGLSEDYSTRTRIWLAGNEKVRPNKVSAVKIE